jgi:hypothetical protein
VIKFDEQPFKAKLDKIPGLKPAFKKDGTITAANASSISDGAAALVLMRESTARQMGCTPVARIVSHAVHAQAPEWFATAPAGAIAKALKKAGWDAKSVNLWEVNEAFAAVTMAAMHEFQLPHEIVNVHGGACALGHPIGASGARIVVTLLGALKKRGLKRGVASLCIGGGEATALAWNCCDRTAARGRACRPAVFVGGVRAQRHAGRGLPAHRVAHLQGGARAGVAAVLGINAGCVVHALAAAFGLAALLAVRPRRLRIIQWAGAAYLVWLGSWACCARPWRGRPRPRRRTAAPAPQWPGRLPHRAADQRAQPQGGAVLPGLPAAVRWCAALCRAGTAAGRHPPAGGLTGRGSAARQAAAVLGHDGRAGAPCSRPGRRRAVPVATPG